MKTAGTNENQDTLIVLGWLKTYTPRYNADRSRWKTMKPIWSWLKRNAKQLSSVELDFDKEPRMPHLDRVLSLALDGTDIQITSRFFLPSSFFVVGVRTTTY